MTTTSVTPFSGMPNKAELKAIRLFMGTDPTRPGLATVWEYANETGCTHVATSGHVIIVRRVGSHLAMTLKDVSMLPRKALDNDGSSPPPAWDTVVKAPNCKGLNVATRRINPAYFALVAEVEKAAGHRAALDCQLKAKRAALKNGARSTWMIGTDPFEGWYWQIKGEKIEWEGVIMPRLP